MNELMIDSTLATPPTTSQATRGSVVAVFSRLRRLATRLEPHGQSALLLALRLLYGWFFLQTGWGKWTNFGRTVEFFAGLHLPAPKLMAGLVASIELLGGILIGLGAGTRYASAILISVLGVALATAHVEEAFTSLSDFTEQAPFPFLVATLILLAFGAGRLSIDGWRAKRN
jgi:putative oxidoreductase